MLKKIFVVLFAIIMVALLSSCGEQEEPQSEKEAFVKFSNCHNEMFLNGLGTLAQYPN